MWMPESLVELHMTQLFALLAEHTKRICTFHTRHSALVYSILQIFLKLQHKLLYFQEVRI
ncbi:unnamed protein product [Larinioides sclopetarius]|uniref:Uncharacterized protein n=1 Tax=Larinioides sclopetarius TaxID=280406 RepID=A0AAV1Z2I0_9ARAC